MNVCGGFGYFELGSLTGCAVLGYVLACSCAVATVQMQAGPQPPLDDAPNLIENFSRPDGIASLLKDTAPRLQQERIMTVNEYSTCGVHGLSASGYKI